MYAELRCKTNFSFLAAASQPEELVTRAAELGLGALAITDTNGVYGVPKAYWYSKDLPGFKLIVGCELTLENHPSVTLLAQNRAAYGLMCRLLTQAHAGKEKGAAFLTLQELSQFCGESVSSGLFCLAGEKSNYPLFKEFFGPRLFIPVSRFKDGHDGARVQAAVAASAEFDVPVLATNDVLFHEKGRKKLQDAFTAIREGVPLSGAGFQLLPNAERYLKSPFEMQLLFRDMPEAIQNTLRIAEACTFSPRELRYRYPSEWIPENHTAQSYLEKLSWEGARERYHGNIPQDVQKQLHHELSLIQKMEFADYFLTIYDIVAFARSRDILCQGRGSAANSIVCYCIGVTAIDPVRMQLLFERFISVERKEPPDIDVDFEHERREEVIQYIYEKYGRNRAAMVSAVITYQRRSAFREISKAFGIPVGTLSAKKVLRDFDTLAKDNPIPQCREQIDALAREMSGFPRHLSIHSGGFTLSADPITEIVPIEPARMEGRTIIQWDKYDLDYLGLLKVDVLALGMLSALKKALDMVGLKLHEVPADDKATYTMIQKADTVGTFQVESRAQMNMSGRLLPRSFYDLVVQVAIVRPGPIVGNMVHPYLKRRHGLEVATYPHPRLREILGRTLGVPLFQEQLMKIAIDLGDFQPGEADQLRRAIGAWRASGSIQKVAEKLLVRLKANGIPEAYALQILEQMKGFAHYGFPESHAASFALLAYVSCYLKRHHPTEFACALVNSQPMGFYANHTLIDDAKLHGVRVLPVDPNFSDWDCTVQNGALRVGLRVVHGLSKKEAQGIVANRPYSSFADFLAKNTLRTDTLYRLIMGDAFAGFGLDPRQSLWTVLSERVHTQATQLDLFVHGTEHGVTGAPGQGTHYHSRDRSNTAPALAPMNAFESVKSHYDAFGLSTHEHPMAALRKIRPLPRTRTFEAKRTPSRTYITTAGLLLVRQKPPTANGVCFSAIEDEFGFLDLVLFQREYEKFKEIFLRHCFLIVGGFIEREGHSVSLIVKNMRTIWKDEAAETEGLMVEPTQYFFS